MTLEQCMEKARERSKHVEVYVWLVNHRSFNEFGYDDYFKKLPEEANILGSYINKVWKDM